MSGNAPNQAAERMRLALEMFALGESLMRQQLRRRHPEATDQVIEEKLRAWLQTRPGAEMGDAKGRPLPLPE